jgi:hypothetical protein
MREETICATDENKPGSRSLEEGKRYTAIRTECSGHSGDLCLLGRHIFHMPGFDRIPGR